MINTTRIRTTAVADFVYFACTACVETYVQLFIHLKTKPQNLLEPLQTWLECYEFQRVRSYTDKHEKQFQRNFSLMVPMHFFSEVRLCSCAPPTHLLCNGKESKYKKIREKTLHKTKTPCVSHVWRLFRHLVHTWTRVLLGTHGSPVLHE